MKLDGVAMISELPLTVAAQTYQPVVVTDDDTDSAMPAALRSWLVDLRLLGGVPFANLVADTELLPEESIRWFYLDRRWTDALVQGALSVGTVNSDDRALLATQYDAIRAELDQEERNRRRQPGTVRFGGSVNAISGFILRSQAVAGWPAMHVRAFTVDPAEGDTARYPEDDPRRMRLLRLDRLAPAVLFCLFDGIPSVVHVEEPRQGVQFGFDATGEGHDLRATLRPRDKASFDYLPENPAGNPPIPVPVPFRSTPGASGVVDIQALEKTLGKLPQTGAADRLDSAEYALQLIRFPWRQVFGEPQDTLVKLVFRPAVEYARLAATFQVQP